MTISAQSTNITFADATVKAICVTNWDTNGDEELSYDEAAAVTDLGQTFSGNYDITSFNELQYFTGLTTIGEGTFSLCFSLTSIIIPSSVSSISEWAFVWCSRLMSIAVDGGNNTYDSRNNCNAIIETATNTLIFGCQSTVIPSNVTTIGSYAFNAARNMTNITIPSSVTTIGERAFIDCAGLTSITIPSSVMFIGDRVLLGCTGLTSIKVDEGNSYYDSRDGCNAIIEKARNILISGCQTTVIPSSVKIIGYEAFRYCSPSIVNIPEGVTSISYGAFRESPSLTSVTIPSTVTYIGERAFEGTSLTSVTIPSGVTSIGEGTFIFSGLTSVVIPSGVTTIGDEAFGGCTNLTDVTIPSSVTNIEGSAFLGCTSLTSVTSQIMDPFEISSTVFSNWNGGQYEFNTSATLYVPAGTKVKYEATPAWNQFQNIVEMDPPAGIPINSTTFPDENFRNWVLAQDYGQDGVLTEAEIAGVTEINVTEKNIASLKGVEYFTALWSLYCQNNQLTSLDLSQNTALVSLSCQNNLLTSLDLSKNTELGVLICSVNQLTSLDLSQNTAIAYLDCNNNQLTSLDISQNTALYRLECYVNQINETEMGNLVESLPANNGQLYVKWFNSSNEQNVITTSQVAAAKAKGWKVYAMNSDYDWVEYDGDAAGIPINSTTFPDENFRNWVLAQDYGQDGVLTEAEIAGVTVISVYGSNIADLKGIEYFTALMGLYCSGNQLTSLDVSQNTALAYLYCGGNQLTSLDVSKNTALTGLNCTINQINEIEMGKLVESLPANNGKLYVKNLNISNEQNVITTAQVAAAKAKGWTVYAFDSSVGDYGDYVVYDGDAAGIPINSTTFPDENFRNWVLAQDYGQDGVLTDAEIAGVTVIGVFGYNIADLKGIEYFTALTGLFCGGNQLTSLNVSQNAALAHLDCNYNQLTSLDVSKNTALTELECYSNQLTSLNVSQNAALAHLDCNYNQLTSLDVSKNTALTQLGCNSNQLTSLDVSKNTALTQLGCDSNQLTSLDVSKNTALTYLACSNNQINETEMGNLVESLPANNGVFYVKRLNYAGEQNVITTGQVAAAKAKGWKVYAWDSNAGDYGQLVEYDGDEPTMEPIDTADFGSDINEGTDLDGNVVGDILYNISSGDGSYNVAEGCIVVTTPTDDSVIDGQDIFGEDFQNNFTGIVFKVPAGKGTVKIEAQTTGTMVLKVKIGNSDPVEMELEGRLKVSFPYNVSEPTYVYIYGGSASAAPGMAGNAPVTGELKLYGIEVVQGETGIRSLSPTLSQGEGAWYTLDGRMLQGEPSEKGLYIHRGRKVVIK